ncbi:MAG TPA: hypothetical protein VMS02_07000, partial [Solirubrobacteraceae bacterium]|nr:hypothetical protein [Solirubrobacteraceae bacterium]
QLWPAGLGGGDLALDGRLELPEGVREVDQIGTLEAQTHRVGRLRAAAGERAGAGEHGDGERERRRREGPEWSAPRGWPAWSGRRYAPSRSTMKISGEFGGIVGGWPVLP